MIANIPLVDSTHDQSLNVNVGGVVSKSMVSVVSAVVFDNASRNLMYQVLIQSHTVRNHHVVRFVLHDCRFDGLGELQNATCIQSTPASVPHVIVNTTHVLFVDTAHVFILNDHHIGAVVSLLMI